MLKIWAYLITNSSCSQYLKLSSVATKGGIGINIESKSNRHRLWSQFVFRALVSNSTILFLPTNNSRPNFAPRKKNSARLSPKINRNFGFCPNGNGLHCGNVAWLVRYLVNAALGKVRNFTYHMREMGSKVVAPLENIYLKSAWLTNVLRLF